MATHGGLYRALDAELEDYYAGKIPLNTIFYPYYGGNNQNWVFETVNDKMNTETNSLHQYTREYNTSNGDLLTFQYIRHGNPLYRIPNWDVVGGSFDTDHFNAIAQNRSSLTFFKDHQTIYLDKEYGTVDLTHMAATVTGLLYNTSWYYHLALSEENFNCLSGWAGDLQTLIIDVKTATNDSSNYQTIYNKFMELMGSSSASFSMPDLLADLDAIYIADNIADNDLGSLLNSYYSGNDYKNRFSYFVGNRTLAQLKTYIYTYTKEAPAGVLEKWPLFKGHTISSTMSEACRDAFADYIWARR